MRLQVTRISEGPGPGEVVVSVSTATGHQEQVVVHVTGIVDDTIDVGYPLERFPIICGHSRQQRNSFRIPLV